MTANTGRNSNCTTGKNPFILAYRNLSGRCWQKRSSLLPSVHPHPHHPTCPRIGEKNEARMFLVGLTGGMGSGKTTTINVFKALGAPVIDADQIARDVVKPGRRAWKKIREQFGDKVFFSDGQLDREALGRQIFSDADKRKQLNAITHPEIYTVMVFRLLLCFLKGYQFVVVDIPLLFETKAVLSFFSFVVVVSCSHDQQLQRLMKRNMLSQEEAESRINTQMSLEEKCRRASFIVDNSGTTEMTEKQVLDLYHLFKRSTAHWPLRVCGWTIFAVFAWMTFMLIRCLW